MVITNVTDDDTVTVTNWFLSTFDGSGEVTSRDARAVLRSVMDFITEIDLDVAHVNHDGIIDLINMWLIFRNAIRLT